MSATGRFRRTDRLLDARDFRRVLRKGRRRAHPDLVVVTCRRAAGALKKSSKDSQLELIRSVGTRRLGITASRKAGNAVRRNRFKRRVREWFRRRRWELEPGLDVVVIARRSGTGLEMKELDERLSDLLGLAHEGGEVEREAGHCGSTDGTDREHA